MMMQQMFQQQLQMQMASMDKHAETTEMYLGQIARSIGSIGHPNNKKRKRKRGYDDEEHKRSKGTDEEDDESSAGSNE